MPVELWYLGVERKIPEFGVEGTKASLQWEVTGKLDKLVVTTGTEKKSKTFDIDINDLEFWAVSPDMALICDFKNYAVHQRRRRCLVRIQTKHTVLPPTQTTWQFCGG